VYYFLRFTKELIFSNFLNFSSTNASGRSAKFDLLDLTDEILGAIETLGKDFGAEN
jgi:hypothetical protein